MPYVNFLTKRVTKHIYAKREDYAELKDIPEEYGTIIKTKYKNYYVTDKGVVISYNVQTDKYIILKQSSTKEGYKHVILITNGKRCNISVHRLVLLSFKPIKDACKYQVNHIDENKENNNLENLEWTTPLYNTEYSQGKQVACYKYPSMEYVDTFKSTHSAARHLKLLQGEIVNVLSKRRNQKHTKGYTFKYVQY